MPPVTLFCPACTRATRTLRTWNPSDRVCPTCAAELRPVPEAWIDKLLEEVSDATPAPTEHERVIRGRVRLAPASKRSKTTRIELVVTGAGGADLLPAAQQRFLVRWEMHDAPEEWWMSVGRSHNNPVYFHNTVRSTDQSRRRTSDPAVTTASLLARAGYEVGDEVTVRVEQLGTKYVVRTSTGSATGARTGDGRVDLDKDRSFQIPRVRVHLPRWSETDALSMIDAYNCGQYLGRRNTDLDGEGYARLSAGLPRDVETLVDDLVFVGRNYAGARESLLPDSLEAESRRIAAKIVEYRDGYERALRSLEPLSTRVPDLTTTEILLAPFHASRSWLVWGTKFLHFLAPDTFPMLDHVVERALGMRRTGYTAHHYVGFIDAVAQVLERLAPILPTLRVHDMRGRKAREPAPDLKLLDKLLWIQGKGASIDM